MHYFSLHFHQPRNREANRTIRMQNSLPLRNSVNYPPNTGNHEQVTGISEVVKNRLEVEGSGRTDESRELKQSRRCSVVLITPLCPEQDGNRTFLSLEKQYLPPLFHLKNLPFF